MDRGSLALISDLNTERKIRTCIMCGREFLSSWPGHRRCSKRKCQIRYDRGRRLAQGVGWQHGDVLMDDAQSSYDPDPFEGLEEDVYC